MVKIVDQNILIVLAGLAITAWLFTFYWRKRRFFALASKIPNHNKNVYLGLKFFGKSIQDCFKELLTIYQTGPEIFKAFFGPFLLVAVSNPEHIKEVLTNPNTINKGPFVRLTKPYLGDGLISADADIWKRHRKMINPVFNMTCLNSFIPIFNAKCEILIKILEKHVEQSDVDILEIFSRCSLDSICETSMGLNVEAQRSDNQYGKLLSLTLRLFTLRLFNPLLHPHFIFNITSIGRLAYRTVDTMNSFSATIINQKKAEYDEKMRGEYVEGENEKKVETFLDHLLKIRHDGEQLTEQEIQDEVNSFIAAASDTTSVALSFCCTMLGMFPEYQQKIYEEAINILGEDRFASKEDLPQLTFTEMFIKETLRLFPAAPLIMRASTNEINIDNLVIPKDSIFLICILHIHRSPKYWDNPMTFNPYRFSSEEWNPKHPYSYMPFSGGPRNCIGRKYAMMFMKSTLAKIVTKFKVKTEYKNVEDVKIEFTVLIRPTDGFKVTFQLRE